MPGFARAWVAPGTGGAGCTIRPVWLRWGAPGCPFSGAAAAGRATMGVGLGSNNRTIRSDAKVVPDIAAVRTWSEPVYRNAGSAKWATYQAYEKDGETLYDGVLHRDTYEALKEKEGRPIPADGVPVAPVDS